jgi:hypothetical protein
VSKKSINDFAAFADSSARLFKQPPNPSIISNKTQDKSMYKSHSIKRERRYADNNIAITAEKAHDHDSPGSSQTSPLATRNLGRP